MAVAVMAGCLTVPFTVIAEQPRLPLHEAGIAVFSALAAGSGCLAGASMRGAQPSRQRTIALLCVSLLWLPLVLVASVVLAHGTDLVPGTIACAPIAWLVGIDAGKALDRTSGSPSDRAGARELLYRFLAGGLLLFGAAGVAQLPSGASFRGRFFYPQASLPLGAFAVAFTGYFLAGILLIGSARYAALAAQWRATRVAAGAGFGRHWRALTLGVTTLAVGLCLAPALAVATGAFGPVLAIARRVADNTFPHYQLPPGRPCCYGTGIFHHTGGNRGGKQKYRPLTPHIAVNATLLAIDILIVVVVLAVLVYLFRRPLLARWRLLSAWLRRLMLRLLRRYGGSLFAPLGTGRQSPDTITISPWKRLLPGLLSPRERILHNYQQLLYRAGRQGMPRRIGQTAGEFEGVLRVRLVGAEGEIERMTGAYLEARFSEHAIDEEGAGRMRRAWSRVREALRNIRRER